jgi:hypothetical protein
MSSVLPVQVCDAFFAGRQATGAEEITKVDYIKIFPNENY